MLYLHRFCRRVTFECFRLDRLLKKFLTYPCQDTAANFRFRLRVRRRRGEPSRAGRSGAAAVGLWVGPHRTAAMEALYRLPFAVLECPNIKLKRPSWVHMPSAMTVYALVVVSYFLITGGEAGAGGGLLTGWLCLCGAGCWLLLRVGGPPLLLTPCPASHRL